MILPKNFDKQARKYAELMLEWNKTHTLTALKNVDEILDNVYDSVAPHTFLEPFTRCLDVGSGNGLPAIPLALLYTDSYFILAEPIKKKGAFLSVIQAELGLKNIRIETKRVEQLVSDKPFDLITSRAVGDSAMLTQLCKKVSDATTRYLFYKGTESAEIPVGFSGITFPRKNGVYLYIKGSYAS